MCKRREPEEYYSVDEQIILSKTKRSKVYNARQPQKMGLQKSRTCWSFQIHVQFLHLWQKRGKYWSWLVFKIGCLLQPNKNLQKNGRRVALDYWVDHNSGVVVVKWMDNKVVELALNFVRVEPMSTWVQRWDKVTTSKKAIPWFQVVIAYNKSMGVVDLANMILALCRIPVTIKR